MIIFLIWVMSCIGVLFFIPWCVDNDISLPLTLFVIICPILNTTFIIYRTYRYFKNGGIILLKDLFKK